MAEPELVAEPEVVTAVIAVVVSVEIEACQMFVGHAVVPAVVLGAVVEVAWAWTEAFRIEALSRLLSFALVEYVFAFGFV